jgi:ABC-type multidrug transport system fused ATPase/permease subunit
MKKYEYFYQSYIRPSARATAGAAIISAIHIMTVFLLPLSTGAFLDLMQQAGTGKTALLAMLGIRISGFGVFFIFFGLLLVLRFALGWYEKALTGRYAELFTARLQNDLYYSHVSSGVPAPEKQLLRYSGDMTGIRSLVEKGWHGGIKDVLMLAGGIALLLAVNPALTLSLLAAGVALGLAAVRMARFVQQRQQQKNNARARFLSFVNESLRLQAFAESEAVNTRLKKFKQKQALLLQTSQRHRIPAAALRSFAQTAGYAALGVALAAAWLLNQANTGNLFVFILLVLTLIPCIRRLIQAPAIWQKGISSLNRMRELTEANIRNGGGAGDTASKPGRPAPLPHTATTTCC